MENQFCGCYNHTIDAKNRIFIPAKFRAALGETFNVFKSPDGCLSIYSEEAWSAVLAQVRGAVDAQSRRKQRILYANVESVEIDKQGRITLSVPMVGHAQLKKDVVVIGADNRIELWDSEKWNSYLNDDDLSLVSNGIEF